MKKQLLLSGGILVDGDIDTGHILFINIKGFKKNRL